MSRLCSMTLRIGEAAPPFALFALNEQVVPLAEVLDEVPLILLFAPGAWSPGTRHQIGEFSAAYERLQVAGIGVLEIITQDARSLRRRLATQMPPFPILADERRETARSYGVFRALSWDGIGVTRPAAFLIDRAGRVRFMYVGESDRDVPEAAALICLAADLFGLVVPDSVEPPEETVETPPALAATEDDWVGRLIAVAEDETAEAPLALAAIGDDSVGRLIAAAEDEGTEAAAFTEDGGEPALEGEMAQGELFAVPTLTATDEPSPRATAAQNGSPDAEPASGGVLVGAGEPGVDREPGVAIGETNEPQPDRAPAEAVSGKPLGGGKAEA